MNSVKSHDENATGKQEVSIHLTTNCMKIYQGNHPICNIMKNKVLRDKFNHSYRRAEY